jgi:hypothetical protein
MDLLKEETQMGLAAACRARLATSMVALAMGAGVLCGSPVGTAQAAPAILAPGVRASQLDSLAEQGAWSVTASGTVNSYALGGQPVGPSHFAQRIVGIAVTKNGAGGWLAGAGGAVYSYGDAHHYASGTTKAIVGIAATTGGGGYWLLGADGTVYPSGSARNYGTVTSGQPVGLASAPGGYWVATAGGKVDAFGAAQSYGSPSGADIVGIAATADSKGYWLLGAHGAVYAFGDAHNYGSPVGHRAVGIGSSRPGNGYWVATASGAVFSYGTDGGPNPRLATGTNQPLGAAPSPTVAVAAAPVFFSAPGPSASNLVVETQYLPSTLPGVAYSQALAASGGTAPYTWGLVSGALPAGLALSPSGVISGTTAAQGTTDFVVRATDSAPTPHTATAALSLYPDISQGSDDSWAGYADNGGPFTSATGTFNIPSIQAANASATNPDILVQWVGVDGYTNGNLIQAGMMEESDPDAPAGFDVMAWWEILPDYPTIVPVALTANAGDKVTVALAQVTPGTWAISIDDITDSQSFSAQEPYAGPLASAEWVVEDPTNTAPAAALFPMPQFPLVTFSGIATTGTITQQNDIVLQSASADATPSALDANGFSVAYGPTAPTAP